MAKRNVFFSFHYKPDNWRSSQVRNIGVIEGNQPVSDNDWESVTKGGDAAIQKWIANQMNGRSCTVVLIGAGTAGRKWIDYEIEKSWKDKKGLLGIHVHNLKDRQGNQSAKGKNPFKEFTIKGESLASVVESYDPPYADSKAVYSYICDNLEGWVEDAIAIRNRY